ncbi:MAG: hypothetical protein Q4F66_00630 [Clostridium sp.]|nr:hypothetical protein [Clostridium sp.]
MYLVNCAWRQDDIIREIEDVEAKGMKLFKHVKTDGIRLYFESVLPEGEDSFIVQYMLIYDAIMRIPGWQALAISILPVVNGSNFDGYKYTVCRPYVPGRPTFQKLLSSPSGNLNLNRLLN